MMLWRTRKTEYDRHPDFPAMGKTGYRAVLSALEKDLSADWYIEIGSRSGASLEDRKCSFIAIDPEFEISFPIFNSSKVMIFCQQTSDGFFAENFLGRMGIKPALAFIDGMHLFEFALRDFMNLERSMGRDGVICIHDVCPFDYEMTTRDPAYLATKKAWTGDVWKVIAILLKERPDLDISVVNAWKTGLAVIRSLDPNSRRLWNKYDDVIARYRDRELRDAGAKEYFKMFELMDASRLL